MSNENYRFIQIVPANGKQFVMRGDELKEVILWALDTNGDVFALDSNDVANSYIYNSDGDDYE